MQKKITILGFLPLIMTLLAPSTQIHAAQVKAAPQQPKAQSYFTLPKTWAPTDFVLKKFSQYPYFGSSVIALGSIATIGAAIYGFTKIQQLKRQVANHNTELQNKEEELKKQYQDKLDAAQKEKDLTATQLQNKENELATAKQQNTEAEQQKNLALQKQKTQLEEQHKNEIAAKLQNKETELATAKQQKEKLEEQLQEKTTAQGQVKEKILTIKTKFSDLKAAQKDLTELKTSLKETVEKAKTGFEEDTKSLNEALQKLKNNEEAQVKLAKEEKEKSTQEITQLKEKLEKYEKALKTKKNKFTGEIQNLKEQIVQLTKAQKSQSLTAQKETEEKIALLEQHKTNLEKLWQDEQTKNKTLISKNNKLINKNKQAIETSKKLEMEKKQLEEKVKKATTKANLNKAIATKIEENLRDTKLETLDNNYKKLWENKAATETKRLKLLKKLKLTYTWAKDFLDLLQSYPYALTTKIIKIQELLSSFVTLYQELQSLDEGMQQQNKSYMLPGTKQSDKLNQYERTMVGFPRVMHHVKHYGDKYLRRKFTPDQLKKLTEDQQTKQLSIIAEEIFDSINNGATIWNNLSDTSKEKTKNELTNKELTELLWYLYYQGLLLSPVRTGPEEFSFVLNDQTNGKVLFNLLMHHNATSKNTKEKPYTRIASHLKSDEGFTPITVDFNGKKGVNASFGLDIWTDNHDGLFLPVGMRTLLFKKATITEDKDGKTVYLFKPETYSSSDWINHGIEFFKARGRKMVAKLPGGKSLDDALNYNKERLPKHISKYGTYPICIIPSKCKENATEATDYIGGFYRHHEDLESRIGNEIPINQLTNDLAQYYAKRKHNAKTEERFESLYRYRRLATLSAIGSNKTTLDQDPITWHNEVIKEVFPGAYSAYLKTALNQATKQITPNELLEKLKEESSKEEKKLTANLVQPKNPPQELSGSCLGLNLNENNSEFVIVKE